MSFINKDKIISEENEYNMSEMEDTKNGFDVTLHNPQTKDSKKITVNNDSRYYTENEIDEKIDIIQVAIDVINGKINSLVNFKVEVLEELPETGKDNVLYFIPKNKESPDTHDEYVWINNAFEFIGTTEIDLAPYAKTEYVNRELEKKSNINHVHVKSDITDFAHNHDDRYYTEEEVDSLLDDKAGLSTATTTSDGLMSSSDKAKLDGVAEGADNVEFTRNVSTGVKIGSLSINGEGTDLYAPLPDDAVEYDVATTTSDGLMSSSDKTKLDGINDGADNVEFTRTQNTGTKIGSLSINGTSTDLYAPQVNIDDALSPTSENPVQNKIVNNAIAGKADSVHTHVQGDVDGLADALAGKADSVHSHQQGDVDGLADALAGKASTSVATTASDGLMSSVDKAKLDSLTTTSSGGGDLDGLITGGVFVSAGGDDTAGTGSFTKPFATITKALTQISSGGTVFLMNGVYSNFAEVTVGKSCSIVGLGEVVLDAGGSNHHLRINNNVSVFVENIVFKNGNASASSGGAIYSSGGSVTATDCTFTGNTANSKGGAIYSSGGSVTATDCTFTGNTATTSGGAIYTYGGSVTATDCTFTNNTTTTSGGGAIYGGSVTATDCTFTNNTANSNGGAIDSGSVTATDCTFTGNTATTYGGAISSGSVTATNSTFTNNTATNGGAIRSSGTINLYNNNIQGNGRQLYGTINTQKGNIINGTADYETTATTTQAGLMSAQDKIKLDGVEITVDSELNSSSINPVQNNIIANALGSKLEILETGRILADKNNIEGSISFIKARTEETNILFIPDITLWFTDTEGKDLTTAYPISNTKIPLDGFSIDTNWRMLGGLNISHSLFTVDTDGTVKFRMQGELNTDVQYGGVTYCSQPPILNP